LGAEAFTPGSFALRSSPVPFVEQRESWAMFDNPKTAYTCEPVDAVPHIEPELAAFAT
jgi:hypothetical protein